MSIDKSPVAKQVSGHGLTLPLFKITICEHSALEDFVDVLCECSFALEARQRRLREKTLTKRRKTCVLFIDGLFQAYSSLVPDTAVAFPHSQASYDEGNKKKISRYSYRNVDACYQALKVLAWVSYCPGFLDSSGWRQPTSIAPAGALLTRFSQTKTHWRPLTYIGEPVIIRLKDEASGLRQVIDTPGTPQAQHVSMQVQHINEFLSDQAFHLNITNSKLKALALRMASSRYACNVGSDNKRTRARTLNFAQVGLCRIFAKGRMDRGGRFYGGWWQTIPKEYRRFITINGRPTIEVDFSEMHPSMLYALHGQQPPENIYELGLTNANNPASRRKFIKSFLNALINDERGVHRLSASRAKSLGLSHEQLKQLILDKHPVIGKALGTDTGLHLQYLDSQIACRVMLELKEQSIVALPVHDSFLVQAEFEPELIATMRSAFTAEMGAVAKLKAPELPQDGFEALGKLRDWSRLLQAHRDSHHHRYVLSWRQQHPQPKHSNLSYYPPYRFPDGQLG